MRGGTRPEVLQTARDSDSLRLDLRVPADLRYFHGHFPGCPILPGVVQLDWAIRLAQEHLGLSPAVARISGLKFSRIVRPGARLTLWLSPMRVAGGVNFRFDGEGGTCSSGSFTCKQ